MALRWYLSKIIQYDRERDPNDPDDVETVNAPKVVALQDSTIRYSAVHPSANWALIGTDNTDAEHTDLVNDADVIYASLEDDQGNVLGLEDTLGDIDSDKRSNIRSWLENRGFPTDQFTLSDTIADLIRAISMRVQTRQVLIDDDLPNDLAMTVGDIPGGKRKRIKDKLEARGFDTSAFTVDNTIRDVLVSLYQQENRHFRTMLD